jgi:hypothetical protein
MPLACQRTACLGFCLRIDFTKLRQKACVRIDVAFAYASILPNSGKKPAFGSMRSLFTHHFFRKPEDHLSK